MNPFRTILDVESSPFALNHAMKGLAIGSCFVENIGGWLQKVKFNLLTNPFGIAYNPISIGQQLTLLNNMDAYSADQLFFHNERWQSFDFHSRFSGSEKEMVIAQMNASFSVSKTRLTNADYLLITFGTANIYTHKKSDQVVANCHKVSNNEFEKKRLTVKEVMTVWQPLLESLFNASPSLKIIFTVSPVRHLKDGIIENQKSKAVLLLAIDNLVNQFDNSFYFPAYELVMDDLRDYRFFEKDMIHPNEVAIDYIKERFSGVYFDEKCKSIVDKIITIQNAVEHRAFNPSSEVHQVFVKKTLDKIEILEREYGFGFKIERDLLAAK